MCIAVFAVFSVGFGHATVGLRPWAEESRDEYLLLCCGGACGGCRRRALLLKKKYRLSLLRPQHMVCLCVATLVECESQVSARVMPPLRGFCDILGITLAGSPVRAGGGPPSAVFEADAALAYRRLVAGCTREGAGSGGIVGRRVRSFACPRLVPRVCVRVACGAAFGPVGRAAGCSGRPPSGLRVSYGSPGAPLGA